ncbi:hypothetical protein KTS45_12535 [Halomicroarcula limicola]|uniref:DUF8053 domain-containing protein n=1 Tax=Haloarcula limicola TaxID=1429915 RepID=A0A8J7YBU7_9EURY|nr:hypothetical protein [Halomicroarcula limicola]MBV0925024.1 hypothetical protein [Halomicroarcula limicola]
MQKLQNHDGSGVVTIPKNDLERDGLLDEGGNPVSDTHIAVERLDERVYVVRMCDGNIPELADCDTIRRIAAERILEEDNLRLRKK